ncbi:MAG: hypothetical protein HY820_43475 [Acidobacteria bacterium]|nr:hypothetical protein [Acidobacteriota bacterium]
MAPKKQNLDAGKTARRVARNVIGTTPSSKVIVPKTDRKPKHKKQVEQMDREP